MIIKKEIGLKAEAERKIKQQYNQQQGKYEGNEKASPNIRATKRKAFGTIAEQRHGKQTKSGMTMIK